MERLPDSSLVIGVATSTAERVQLARLLGGADLVLLVSSADQARAFLELAGSAPPAVGLDPDSPTPNGSAAARDTGSEEEPPPEQPQARTQVESHPSGLVLDVDRRVIRWQDREISLTRLEHDFLQCLMAEPGEVWSYERLHLEVWGNEHLGHGSHLHSVVKRLRRKLTRLGAPTIHAVRGVGFHLPTQPA